MATKTEIIYLSDISGVPLSPDNHVQKKFAIGRKNYVLDMTKFEAANFERSINKWTDKATHVPKKRKRRAKR